MKKTNPKDSMADLFMEFAEKEWGVKFVDVNLVKPGGEKGIIRTIKVPGKKIRTLK